MSSTISASARLQLLFSASVRTKMVFVTVKRHNITFYFYYCVLPILSMDIAKQDTLVSWTYSSTGRTSQHNAVRNPQIERSTTEGINTKRHWQTDNLIYISSTNQHLPIFILIKSTPRLSNYFDILPCFFNCISCSYCSIALFSQPERPCQCSQHTVFLQLDRLHRPLWKNEKY